MPGDSRRRGIVESGDELFKIIARLKRGKSMAERTLNLRVDGMTCGNCARSVERKLASTPGVTKASVDLPTSRATVEYDADLVKPDVLVNAVRQLGYKVAA